MNLYDTIQISCHNCKTPIGEIDYDALVIRPLCGKCANPMPEGDDMLYVVNAIQNQSRSVIIIS